MIDPEHEFRDAQRDPAPESLARELTAAVVVFVALPALTGLVIAGLMLAASR